MFSLHLMLWHSVDQATFHTFYSSIGQVKSLKVNFYFHLILQSGSKYSHKYILCECVRLHKNRSAISAVKCRKQKPSCPNSANSTIITKLFHYIRQ